MISPFDTQFNKNSAIEAFGTVGGSKPVLTSDLDYITVTPSGMPSSKAPEIPGVSNDNETCMNMIASGPYEGKFTCPNAYMGAGGHCVCGAGCVEFVEQEGAPPICCSQIIEIRGDKFCVDDIPAGASRPPTNAPTGTPYYDAANAISGSGSTMNSMSPYTQTQSPFSQSPSRSPTKAPELGDTESCKHRIESGHYAGQFTCPGAFLESVGHCNCGPGCVEFIESEGSPPVCCTSIINIRGDKFCVNDAPVGQKSYYKETTEAPLGTSTFDAGDVSNVDTKSNLIVSNERFGNMVYYGCPGIGGSFAIFLIILFIILIIMS